MEDFLKDLENYYNERQDPDKQRKEMILSAKKGATKLGQSFTRENLQKFEILITGEIRSAVLEDN